MAILMKQYPPVNHRRGDRPVAPPGPVVVLLLLALLLAAGDARAARVKDITDLGGVRANQLVGYGLAIGLQGTGDDQMVRFTLQSLASMLSRFGVNISERQLQVRNVAAVMVTTELPAFARAGSRLDVQVSSIGNAKSLQGGLLLLTPLNGADGKVYALAQGSISVAGYSASGSSGSREEKNHTAVGRVPGGAVIEIEVPNPFRQQGFLEWVLRNPDFTTAVRVARAINDTLEVEAARAVDRIAVRVKVPEEYAGRLPALVALVEQVEVEPDTAARVVINERTGTVVVGEQVRLRAVAIAHGALQVSIRERFEVSQPEPSILGPGETVVVPESEVSVEEQPGPLNLVARAATIGDLVRGLNAIGASPRDLIGILQALKAAGALEAELEIL